MEFIQDGVEVYCLPDEAYCAADKERRSPLDISECPVGGSTCDEDCYYYREDGWK